MTFCGLAVTGMAARCRSMVFGDAAMRRVCTFLMTTAGGQIPVGSIALDGKGQLVPCPAREYPTLLSYLMAEPVIAHGKQFTIQDNPVGWFEGLPYQYRGSYFKARIKSA
jgi:hypothetical protein